MKDTILYGIAGNSRMIVGHCYDLNFAIGNTGNISVDVKTFSLVLSKRNCRIKSKKRQKFFHGLS
jgi:hypothetical protein